MTDRDREAFEAAMRATNPDVDLVRVGGEYLYGVQQAWQGWQLHAAHVRPVVEAARRVAETHTAYVVMLTGPGDTECDLAVERSFHCAVRALRAALAAKGE